MEEAWNYIQNGKVEGPVPEGVLRGMLASGTLGWEDLVWRQGMAEWAKAGQFPELRTAPAEVPAPPRWDPPRSASLAPVADPRGGVNLDAIPEAIEALRATKPWVRFLAVLGFIGTALMILVSLVILVSQHVARGFPAGLRPLVAVGYLLIAILYVVPVVFLNRYASRIGTLLEDQTSDHLAQALEAQKSFWRYVGILALIVTILYGLIFVLGAGMAVFLGALRHL